MSVLQTRRLKHQAFHRAMEVHEQLLAHRPFMIERL
jgi:hypothetical protein